MSDDILNQLKDLAASLKRGEGRSTVYGAVSEIERLHIENKKYKAECAGLYENASNDEDEIERLREQLALWKKTAKHIRYHHCKPIGCQYCAIYAEEYPNDPVVE